MQHNDFLITQIKSLLLAGSKCDESEANAAVALALEYRRTHPNAGVQAVIDKAKFYLKHNRRPVAYHERSQSRKPRFQRVASLAESGGDHA